MLDYLCREKLVRPSGSAVRRRGKARLFSYGDILLLRMISGLLASGVEVRRLKKALRALHNQTRATEPGTLPFRYLVTDGVRIYLRGEDGSLETITEGGQLAFAFVIDVRQAAAEIINHADEFRLVA